MKRLFIFGYLLLFISCATTPSPRWFDAQNIQHKKSQIIGYGQAKSENEAMQIAKGKIGEMLQTDIDSVFIIDKTSSDSSYSKKVNQTIKTSSSVRLNALRVIKKEKIDGIWFVAIVYDHLPLFQKMINANSTKKPFTHPYLSKTKLFKQLKSQLGFYPKVKIYSQNGQYYISINNQQFLISQQEFVELFINNSYPNISIQLKERLKHNEAYFITTKFKEAGFASLFLVASSGTVVTMFKNIKLVNETITYPDKNKYDGLRAKIEGNSRQSKEMFVSLLCKQKEDIGLFNQVPIKELEKDSFLFGDLVDLMGRCAFSAKIFTIYR